MNEIILLSEIIITFLALILANKFFGKKGLYIWLVISIILSSILSVKTITIFSFEVSLGIVPYVSNFICINILIQKYGPNQQKNIITSGILSITITYLLMFVIQNYATTKGNFINNDIYNNIFKIDLRYFIALILTYITSVIANIEVYYQIRRNKNKIWMSNLVSTIIVFFTDTIVFSLIAYINELDTLSLIILIIISTLIKYITSIIGTSAIYLCSRIED